MRLATSVTGGTAIRRILTLIGERTLVLKQREGMHVGGCSHTQRATAVLPRCGKSLFFL